MKALKYLLFAIIPLFIFSGCENDDADNPVFADNEMPRIFMDWQANLARKLGETLTLSPVVSPSDGATYKWTLDGEVISTDRELNYALNEVLVNAELKFEVTRNNISNSRQAEILVVNDFIPKDFTYKVVGYLTERGSIADVDWENISHLILSSVDVDTNGELDLSVFEGIDTEVLAAFAHHYGVQVLLEISGNINYLNAVATYGSWTFYDQAVGATQDAFVDKIVALMKEKNLDGINIYMDKAIDGAYVDPTTLKTFYEKVGTKLKSEKNTIDGNEYDYLLSMSVYSGWTNAALLGMVNIPTYDWINVLAFAAEDLNPGLHSSVSFATGQANQWLNWYGVARSRIVLATPAFGLRYFGNPANYTWANLGEFTEYMTYASICSKYPDAPSTNTIVVKDGAEVDKTYYDGLDDIKQKADYIVSNNMGGMALWSLESDSKDASKSLLKKINDSLGN